MWYFLAFWIEVVEETSSRFKECRDEQLFLISFRTEEIDQVGKD